MQKDGSKTYPDWPTEEMKYQKYPCSNGIQSNTLKSLLTRTDMCLNPCFNGIQSNVDVLRRGDVSSFVLILVLMEYNQTHHQRS